MTVMKLSALAPTVACLLLLAACDDGTTPPPPPVDSGLRDTGVRDSGPPPDGSVDPMDAGDSSTPPPRDAGPLTCSVTPDDVFNLAVDPRSAPRIVGFAAGPDGFGVAWNETRDGFPDIFAQRIGSDGMPGAEVKLTDDPSQDRAPQITPVGTQWVAAYVARGALAGEASHQPGAGEGPGVARGLGDRALDLGVVEHPIGEPVPLERAEVAALELRVPEGHLGGRGVVAGAPRDQLALGDRKSACRERVYLAV